MITWANLKSRLVVISTAMSIAAVAWGIVHGLLQWTAEVQARQAEIELRASREFLSLMEFAHNRSTPFFSEKCVETMSKRLEHSKDTPVHLPHASNQAMQMAQAYNQAVQTACAYSLPVGAASQAAAMDMLASFGIRFPFLREAAREALMAFKHYQISPAATSRAIQRLERN